ncbi:MULTISPECIES: LysR family transcriptional regulator [Spirulina sp. CCY15215]|uniref:LysR family transcriptional regulator n=1 Tax=Spirulina sp. CCY15215 TaxID=2767591 RepID=UPI0019518787|nr:LysR family transcriptional regulator [Spirulina major]
MQATLHQLKVFATVARHRSFTKAADELNITQPTVSSQVKHLANTLGLPLFEQIGKQLYLTEVGEALLGTCRDIFDRLENFEMQVADFKGMKRGKLRLAAVTTTKYFVPRLLGSFCATYPEIDISLQVINHQQLIQRMTENEDDLYILSNPPKDINLEVQKILENPLVVVAKSDHPLAEKHNISIQELNGESFISREAGSGTRRAIQELLNKHKVSVRVRLELGSNEAIKHAIAGGLGISVLSQHSLFAKELESELAILDVREFPIERYWYVAYLSSKQLSTIAQTFLEYLLEQSQF